MKFYFFNHSKHLRRILIKYGPNELISYICLSSFLKLCGFVVGDGMNIKEISFEKEQGFDMVVILSKENTSCSTDELCNNTIIAFLEIL